MNKKLKTRLKIVGATMTTIFSLFSVFTATLAWFASKGEVTATGMQVSVRGVGGSRVDSIRLIKFDYNRTEYGTGADKIVIIDYLDPSTGAVNSYDFNETEGTFGSFVEVDSQAGNYSYVEVNGVYTYVKGAANSGNYIWQSVNTMNVYDPIEKVIKGDDFDLSELRCNAIYEITLSSSNFTSACHLSALSSTFTPNGMTANDILLSDCVDFDVFCLDELQFAQNEEVTDTKIYDKVSLLASSGSNYHFYPDTDQDTKKTNISLLTNAQSTRDVSQVADNLKLKVYVNVNYSPIRAAEYTNRIQTKNENIKAFFDFIISFEVNPVDQGE